MIDSARQLVRREGFWCVALLLLTLIPELTTMVASLSLTFSSVTIYPIDLVCLVLAVVGAVRLVTGWRTHSRVTSIAIIGLLFLLLIGLIRGYALFGLQESVNNVRVPFYALAALLYASTVPFRWSRADLWGALPTLIILVSACILRFAQDGLLIRPGVEGVSSAFELRPVTSAGALLLLATALLLVTPVGSVGRVQLILASGLVILLVLVQQRTVWICLVVGLGVLVISRLVLEPGVRQRLGGIRIIGLGALAAVAVLLVIFVPSLRASATDSQTFSWRQHQWKAAIDSIDNPVDWIIGRPRGSTRLIWSYVYNGSDYYLPSSNLTTHSFYFDTLYFFGIIGLVLLLGLFVYSMSPGIRHDWVSAAGMLSLGVIFIVYGVSYFLPAFAFGLVGMALSARARVPKSVANDALDPDETSETSEPEVTSR